METQKVISVSDVRDLRSLARYAGEIGFSDYKRIAEFWSFSSKDWIVTKITFDKWRSNKLKVGPMPQSLEIFVTIYNLWQSEQRSRENFKIQNLLRSFEIFLKEKGFIKLCV